MNGKNVKKLFAFVLALSVFCASNPVGTTANVKVLAQQNSADAFEQLIQNEEIQQQAVFSKEDILLDFAVVCCGGESYKETVSHLENSLNASKTVTVIDVREGISLQELSEYDCVYPDETVINGYNSEETRKILEEYVFNGGSMFLTNGFCNYFDDSVLGISEKTKLDGVPKNLVSLVKGTDLEMLGEIVVDFAKLFGEYSDYSYFKTKDYGYGFKTTTAISVVESENVCLYALNKYGKGNVFITNPLLPNVFNVNSFDRQESYFSQRPFASTSAGANTLIKGEFASYVSKEKYGFCLERTFGSYGTTPIAWQLHYEEISGFENNSAILFSEICKKYFQVPSFTLIRNTYRWFSKYETMSYLDINNNICNPDFDEGAYSGGSYVISDDNRLSLVETENTGSYFVDQSSTVERLFPAIYDYDSDGMDDAVCGSSDGKIYVFLTKALYPRWVCDAPFTLKDEKGRDIDVGTYSAPTVCDFDNDGKNDIISGSENGAIYFIKNNGNGSFSSPVYLASTGTSMSMPVVGDVDNDGKDELVCGSNKGRIYAFELDAKQLTSQKLLLEIDGEGFVSPYVCSFKDDGYSDLYVGTYDGYVRRFAGCPTGFQNMGYVMCGEKNYKGNYRAKFGNNCTPRLFDADGDGNNELVCGYIEYGLNVPIDSEYFHFSDELQSQIDYIERNDFYLGVHFYTNEHASPKREAYELEAHKKAFEHYGVSTDGVGVNQHTWYTSQNSPTQSFESAKNAGFLWNSGGQSSKSLAVPQVTTENVLGIPAYFDDEQQFLVFNTGSLLYLDDSISDLTAKYNLPLSVYYHCDFAYKDLKAAERDVKQVNEYVKRNNMSFVKEDELAKMASASVNSNVTCRLEDGKIILSSTTLDKSLPLYDEKYSQATGVRIEFKKGADIDGFYHNADVYYFEDNGFVVTMNKEIVVGYDENTERESHIACVNIPCKINRSENLCFVSFEGTPAYCEIKVCGKAKTSTQGWTTQMQGQYTVFKAFGNKNITVEFQ